MDGVLGAGWSCAQSMPFTANVSGGSTPARVYWMNDAIAFDAGTHAFFDGHLTAKCANSGQSGCGDADKVSRDGAGTVANDGTWTTYELSHPLARTPGEDFVRAAGQQLGFFLTLRIGKGAQGNTQGPGFRAYRSLTIAGS